MKTHSKNSLFLMELIIALLVLSLSCAIMVQILSAAFKNRQTARADNNMKALLVTIGEALEAWKPGEQSLSSLLPAELLPAEEGEADLTCYYGQDWRATDEAGAFYRLVLTPFADSFSCGALIRFTRTSTGQALLEQTISFPLSASFP